MKRSVFRQIITAGSLMVLLLMFNMSQSLKAQDEDIKESQSVSISTTEDGKVKLKVLQKKGNDETTFEKTYDSYEDMQNDPDLEKYGIGKNALNFRFGGGQPQFFFHNGPGNGFWDQDDFDMSPFRDMQERMREMMKGFGSNFAFGFDDDRMMDLDSLTRKFDFRNDNGRFFFNGEEITDIDSLRSVLKDQFGAFNFSFDFGDDWGNDIPGFWRNQVDGDQEDDADVKVITRAQVMVRAAKPEDKKVVGTEQMESLDLKDISFYPNPSDGKFDVELDSRSNDPVQIIIVDKDGNEVYNRVGKPSDGRYDFSVDLTHEGKGIYIMKLVQNDKALTKRVVVE